MEVYLLQARAILNTALEQKQDQDAVAALRRVYVRMLARAQINDETIMVWVTAFDEAVTP